jgi:hypothetical protein
MSEDGRFLIEGYFIDGKRSGPSREIKLSRKWPGCATIREGDYVNDVAKGQFK